MTDTATVEWIECVVCAHRSPTLAVNVVTGVCDDCARKANQRTTA